MLKSRRIRPMKKISPTATCSAALFAASRQSTLWELALPECGGKMALVKTPKCNDTCADGDMRIDSASRPRLFQRSDGPTRASFEFKALQAIDEHFSRLGDARFGSIRPLQFFPENGTIVMQKAPGRPLKGLIACNHRLRSVSARRAALAKTLNHVGAWLREFHEIAPPSHTQPLYQRRGEFVESIQALVDFLQMQCRQRLILCDLVERIQVLAQRLLPPCLTTALAHNDFAPRNILVDSNGRISAIDTAGRWCTPVYMDVAYFNLGLKAPRVQIYSCGCAFKQQELATYSEEFLAGYFGDCIPWPTVRLFEIQALLDRWAAAIERLAAAGARGRRADWRHPLPTVQRRLTMRFFECYLGDLLRESEAA